MSKLSKVEAKEEIEKFFEKINSKKPKEVKKIKRLAMRYSIKLGNKRKLFCKKCFSPFDAKNSEVRIRKGKKTIKCKKCDVISRWKI